MRPDTVDPRVRFPVLQTEKKKNTKRMKKPIIILKIVMDKKKKKMAIFEQLKYPAKSKSIDTFNGRNVHLQTLASRPQSTNFPSRNY